MKKMLAITLLFVASSIAIYSTSHNVSASEMNVGTIQTVKYSIEHMTCITCPITVRRAMKNVDGVIEVVVDFKAKTAVVKFDSSKTSIQEVGLASTNAGYKATAI